MQLTQPHAHPLYRYEDDGATDRGTLLSNVVLYVAKDIQAASKAEEFYTLAQRCVR